MYTNLSIKLALPGIVVEFTRLVTSSKLQWAAIIWSTRTEISEFLNIKSPVQNNFTALF